MSRRRHGEDLESADGDDLAGPQVVVSAAEGAHRRAGQLVEAVGALGVVEVPVRQQGQRDPAAGPGDVRSTA